MYRAYWFVLVVASISIFSCAPVVHDQDVSIVERVCLSKNEKTFRGMQLGSSMEHVREFEKLALFDDKDSILEYHEALGWRGDTLQMVVYYTFDSYGLFEVQVDLFAETEEGVNAAFSAFEAHYDTLFGEPDCSGQVCRWTTVSGSNSLVEVTLSNESAGVVPPFLSINYLEPLSNEI